MTELPLDDSVTEVWKSFPLRITDGSKSECCGFPVVLVQSMDGGFVTRNCPSCSARYSLSDDSFRALAIWVACPRCRLPMEAGRLPYSNYGYLCQSCQVSIRLASLLPRWTDIQHHEARAK
jgi:predicted Zn finger-like uncharacterized protein